LPSPGAVIADGLILSASAARAPAAGTTAAKPGGAAAASAAPVGATTALSAIYAPITPLTLTGTLTGTTSGGAAAALSATLSPPAAPGLALTLAGDPFAAAAAAAAGGLGARAAAAGARLTVDYAPPRAPVRLRAAGAHGGGGPIDASIAVAAAGPALVLGASAALDPRAPALGGRGGAAAAAGECAPGGGVLAGWSLGGAWSRHVPTPGGGGSSAARQQARGGRAACSSRAGPRGA
jgi:hypothetical protein